MNSNCEWLSFKKSTIYPLPIILKNLVVLNKLGLINFQKYKYLFDNLEKENCEIIDKVHLSTSIFKVKITAKERTIINDINHSHKIELNEHAANNIKISQKLIFPLTCFIILLLEYSLFKHFKHLTLWH